MNLAEARASGGTSGLRDPFGWREALTPPSAVSPASTARSSRSICSARGSNCSNAPTPTSVTPPDSPKGFNLSARSGCSNTSSRSGGSARFSAVPVATLPYPTADGSYPTAGGSSGSGSGVSRNSARSSAYVTPNSSARMSEFGSVYDSQSHCSSARVPEPFSRPNSVSELYAEPSRHPDAEAHLQRKPGKKKSRAFAAAFDAFASPASAASPLGAEEPESVEASLDPRHVFSAARHGRHKEVEASLAAGFDPAFPDSYGNTLFHIACQNGVKRIAKLAIKYGGDMDAQNQKGNTGVHFLYAYGYQDVGEYFIEKGASDQILNELGKPPSCGIR